MDCASSASKNSILFCEQCNEAYCSSCAFKEPVNMQMCGGCYEAACGECSEMKRCRHCGESFCPDCWPGCECREERRERRALRYCRAQSSRT